MRPAQADTRAASPLLWLAIALPVAVHCLLLWLFAVNAPRLDDFAEILTFLPDWHAAGSLQEQLAVFFRDYQNHRYVLYHALLLAFGGIDFRTAAIAGNLTLPLLGGLLLFITRRHPQRDALWIVTALLVFNLQAWRAMFWGPLGTTNLLYPAIGLLACWLATRGTRGVVAAAVTAVLLTLSHGSGPLLFPVIAVYLWLQRQQQTPAMLTGWLALTAIVFTLYFLVFPLRSEAGYSSVSTAALISHFFTRTLDMLQGFLALLGSVLLYNDASQPWKHQLAISQGAVVLLWLGWLLHRGALRDSPALRLWLAYLLLVAASIASGRVAYAGIDQALQGHYKLLNGMVLWLAIAATLDRYPRAALPATALVLALYLAALALFLAPLQALQQALRDDVQQWQHSGKLQFIETRLYVKQPNQKIKAAIEGGFYDPVN
jgi:hypothetical protein